MDNLDVQLSGLHKNQKTALIDIIKEEKLIKYKFIFNDKNDKGNNYMGEMLRVMIEGETETGKKIIKNLILKIAPAYAVTRQRIPIEVFYYTEIFCYKVIQPAFKLLQDKADLLDSEKFHFIECYATSVESLNEFLVMDDMNVRGFEMCSRKKPLDIDHMRLAIKSIAQYHSLSFALRKLNPRLYREITDDVESRPSFHNCMETFLNITARDVLKYVKEPMLKKTVEEYSKDIFQRVMKCVATETCEPYNVLCHGDYWQNNILFKYKDGIPVELRLVDWQLVKHSSPFIDIFHLLYSATEESLRHNHKEELLELYYDTLRTSLSRLGCDVEELYPRNVFEEQQKKISYYSFVFTMISLSLLMREDSDVPDIEAVMKESDNFENVDISFKNQKSVNDFVDRFNGVVRDFIQLDLST